MVGLLNEQHKHQLDALSTQHAQNLTALTDQHRSYLDHTAKTSSTLSADLQHSLSDIETKMKAVVSTMEDVSATMDDLTAHQQQNTQTLAATESLAIQLTMIKQALELRRLQLQEISKSVIPKDKVVDNENTTRSILGNLPSEFFICSFCLCEQSFFSPASFSCYLRVMFQGSSDNSPS